MAVLASFGFETGAQGWDAQGESYDTFAQSSAWANTGTFSLEVAKNSTAANFYDWSEAPFAPGTAHYVASGEVLTVNLVLRTAADHTVTNAVFVVFGCYDGAASFLGNSTITTTGAVVASTTYTIDTTWTVGTDYATTRYVRLNLYEEATAGQKLHVYIDDVTITNNSVADDAAAKLGSTVRGPLRISA